MRGLFVLFGVSLLAAASAGDGKEMARGINEILTARHGAIAQAWGDRNRAKAHQDLLAELEGLEADGIAQIRDDTVLLLAANLQDEQEYSRHYAAISLGVIACRAKVALPALRAAKARFPGRGGNMGTLEIELAFGPDAAREIADTLRKVDSAEPC